MSKNFPAANPEGYGELLEELVTRIRTAQQQAALAVNTETVFLYWSIGRTILARQEQLGWGAKVIDSLAQDIRKTFPEVQGFSPRNIRNMRDIAREFPNEPIWQQLLPKCPWGHLLQLMSKVKNTAQREWYLRACIQHGWSRNVFVHQIETKLFERDGAASTNFDRTLPAVDSELAQQTLKDPYIFDFLTLADDALEQDLERGLLDNLQRFMLELGQGFAFVGRQYRLDIGGDEFYIDLLFYHVRLHRYVVIELKTGKFQPEYVGKLGFYLTAVDNVLRTHGDGPSIGILLCKEKNQVVAEYALQDSTKPMGISEYRTELPAELAGMCPPIRLLQDQVVRISGTVEAGSRVTGALTVTRADEPEEQ